MTILTRLQTVYLLFWMIMGTGVLIMPFGIARYTLRDGWVSALLIFVGLSITVLIVYAYSRTFEKENLVTSFKLAFGPILGTIIGLWYLVWLLVAICVIWRELILFMEVTVFTRTTLTFLAAIFAIPMIYGAMKGIESLGRTAEFFAPLMYVSIAALVILSLRYADFHQLQPVMADGWRPVVRGAILPNTTYILQLILALQIYTHLATPRKVALDVAIAGTLIVAFIVIIEVISIGVLGNSLGYIQYSILEVVRTISISRFVSRFDTLYVMGVLMAVYLKLTFYIYMTSSAFAEVFNLTSYKSVVFALTAAGWSGTIFLVKSNVDLGTYNSFSTPSYYIFTAIIIPSLTIVVFRLRKKFASTSPEKT